MKKFGLKNGLEIVLDKRETNSLTVMALIKSGSNDERPKKLGLSHFLEHLVFNGPKNVSKKELSHRIYKIGGEFNAFTSNNVTVYYVKILPKHLHTALKTIQDLIVNAFFKKREIEHERKIIISEIHKLRDTPEREIFDFLLDSLFPNHVFGNNVIGDEKTVNGITKKDIEAHYRKHYVANNMALFFSGKFEEENVMNEVNQLFGHVKSRKIERIFPRLPSNSRTQRIIERNVNQAHLAVGFKVPNCFSKESLALELICAYLGGGLAAVLPQEIREKRGLAYSVNTSLDMQKEYGLFTVYCGVQKENIEKVKKIIKKEFENLKANPLTQNKLNEIKTYYEGNLKIKQDDSLRIAKTDLYLHLRNEESLNEFLSKVLKVSSLDIQKAAKKYLNFDEGSTVIISSKNQ